MARKDNSPVISFFSFQDIITSVTGIMFLVMLILTLMLLLRDLNDRASKPAVPAEVQSLQATISQLEEQISNFASRSKQLRQRIAELEKLDAKTIPQRIKLLAQQLRNQEMQCQTLVDEQVKIKHDTDTVNRQIAALLPSLTMLSDELKTLTDDNASKEKEKAVLEKEAKDSSRMMRFTWSKSIAQKPLLVECGENYIRVGNYNTTVPLEEFCSDSSVEGTKLMLAQFLSWAKTKPKKNFYFILLSKPGAFNYVEVISQLLGDDGYQRGREVLPDDDVIIFEAKK